MWWAECVDQDQADGDRVILQPEIPCHSWSYVEIPQQRTIVETLGLATPRLGLRMR